MRTSRAAVSLVALAAVGAAAMSGCGGGTGVASPRRTATGADPTGAIATGASAVGRSAGAGGATEDASVPRVATLSGTDATEMQVTILGGPDTGTHRASSQSATCSYGLAAVGDGGSEAFANQFADDSSPGLSAVQLLVPDTRSAVASGTDRFALSVTIGKPSRGHTYAIDTLPERGRQGAAGGHGRVGIVDDGPASTVTVRGEAADGTALEVVIRCNRVLDAAGQPRR